MNQAMHLIETSYFEGRIVWAQWSEELEDALSAMSQDGVECADYVEFWGCDDLGAEWRVHLSRWTGNA